MSQFVEKFNGVNIFLKKYQLILKVIFIVVLSFFVLRQVNLNESLNLLKKINIFILIPVLLYLPALLISAYKWKKIINYPSLWELFKIYWISNFFSNFLPSTVGGDGYRVLKLGKVLGRKKVLASVVVDRVSGLIGTLILSVIFLYSIIPYVHFQLSLKIFLIGFVCLLVICLIGFILRNKARNLIRKVLDAFIELRVSWKEVFLISLLYPFCGVLSLWTYYFMFGYKLNFILMAEIYFFIQIVSLIPLSINALGIYELSMISLLSLLGVPAEISFNISILSRLVMALQTSIGGIFYIFENRKTGQQTS